MKIWVVKIMTLDVIMKISIVTINYYNKKHQYKKLLTSYIDTELTQSYILNMIPTTQKDDIYLIENINIEEYEG